jgi:hypothetical protein
MSFALTQMRTPVNAKALGLIVAAIALGSGTTIATVATASHQALPSVTSHAPQQAPSTPDTQDTAATSDSATSNSTTTNNANSNAFGQQVVQQVNTCKAQAATAGTHGIGQCVSSWVVKNNPGASHHTH